MGQGGANQERQDNATNFVRKNNYWGKQFARMSMKTISIGDRVAMLGMGL